jgi:hypothetical protein
MKVVRYCLSAACFAGIFCIALAAQTQSRRPALHESHLLNRS